jgi:MFS family permease
LRITYGIRNTQYSPNLHPIRIDPRRLFVLDLLRQRNFGLLWWGGLISFIGDWILFVSLPLYVLNITGSVPAMGALILVGRLPSILLGSIAGVYVDRWDRKWTLVICNVILGFVIAPLIFVQGIEQVWLVYLVSLAGNIVRQFLNPAEDALLPKLVGEDNLVVANALNSMNNNLSRLIGPAVGGVVFAVFGFPTVVLLDVTSFFVAAGMIALIAAPASITRATHAHDEETGERKKGLLREWLDGLDLVRRNRIVYGLFIVLGVNMLAEGMLSVLAVVWVKSTLNGGSIELGWILTAQAVGGLLGSLFVGRVAKFVKPWQFVAWGFILLGIIDFMIFNSGSVWTAVVLMAVVGLPVAGLFAGAMTLLQTSVEDRFRGRVMGAFGTTSALVMLVSTGFASLVGSESNAVLLLSAAAILDVLAGVAAFWLLRGAPAPQEASATPVPADGRLQATDDGRQSQAASRQPEPEQTPALELAGNRSGD